MRDEDEEEDDDDLFYEEDESRPPNASRRISVLTAGIADTDPGLFSSARTVMG